MSIRNQICYEHIWKLQLQTMLRKSLAFHINKVQAFQHNIPIILTLRQSGNLLLVFHKIHCGAVSIEQHKFFATAHNLKVTMSSHRLILFDLILYVPSTIFQLNRDGSSWVEPVLC